MFSCRCCCGLLILLHFLMVGFVAEIALLATRVAVVVVLVAVYVQFS